MKESVYGVPPRMPFGQHKGLELTALPDSYLIWLLDQSFIWTPRNKHLVGLLCDEERRRLERQEQSLQNDDTQGGGEH